MTKNILPKGWSITILNNIVALNTRYKLEDSLDVGFVPMAMVPTNISGKFQFEHKTWKEVKKGYTHFKNGDVLLAKITPCFENEKSVIVKNLPNKYGAGSTEYLVFQVAENILDSRLLLAFFKSREFLKNGFVNMTGSVGHKRVPKDFVLNYPFLLPPIKEQTRIANKLDKLLTKLDICKTRLDTIPSIIKLFRQSVLAAATSGKLTKAWRLEKGINKNWQKKTVGDVAEVATGKTPLKSIDYYYKNGTIPWLTSSVTGLSVVNKTESFVTQKAVDECNLRKFKKGTLLVAMYGEGKTRGQTTEIAIDATINQACAAVIADDELIESQYLKICLLKNYESMRMLASGGNQPNLNLSKVRSIPVLLPQKNEQKKIVKEIEALFTLAAQAEDKLKIAQQQVDNLTQSILAKAFRGELVPQDPNDEPAEKLLERIKQQREADKTKKKVSRRKVKK
jgi:type I restriction enzyme S subunit